MAANIVVYRRQESREAKGTEVLHDKAMGMAVRKLVGTTRQHIKSPQSGPRAQLN
jgi:hypothetical protein